MGSKYNPVCRSHVTYGWGKTRGQKYNQSFNCTIIRWGVLKMSLTPSLRSRFMTTVVVVICMLLAISIYAYNTVQSNTIKSYQKIRTYYDSHQVIRGAKDTQRQAYLSCTTGFADRTS